MANFIQARVAWEERISTEKMPPSDWPVRKSVQRKAWQFLMIGVGGPSPLWVVSPLGRWLWIVQESRLGKP